MTLNLLPLFVRENYEVHEWKHACAILKQDFPEEWADLCALLLEFRLKKSWITVGGGRKSKVSECIDVKSRLFIDSFDEQIRFLLPPGLERLNWSLMMQGALRDAVVVG